jgi:peptidoglycan/LPS O-acetylase OafA/YrhL
MSMGKALVEPRTVEVAESRSQPPAQGAGPRPSFDRLPSLTGLRWLAAFMVFGFHMGTLNVLGATASHKHWDLVFGQGASGVSFFFILSGFVLVWATKPGDRKRDFWRRRFAKIYPNHVTTWAIVILITLAWGQQVSIRVAAANLALIQPWLLHGNYLYSINTVSWSLGCEAFFYLCFPFVLPVLRRTPAILLAATAAALLAALYYLPIWLGPHFAPVTMTWITYMLPPYRSIEFWLGAVVGQLVVTRRYYGPGLWTASVITALVWWLNHSTLGPYQSYDLDLVYVLLIAGAAKADLKGVWSPWRLKPLVFLGEISFAFYMVHVELIANVMQLMGKAGIGWRGAVTGPIAIAGVLGMSIVAAWLLYRCVEVPMMRRLRPKSSRRKLPPIPVLVSAGEQGGRDLVGDLEGGLVGGAPGQPEVADPAV